MAAQPHGNPRNDPAHWWRVSLRARGVAVLAVPLAALFAALFSIYWVEGDVRDADQTVMRGLRHARRPGGTSQFAAGCPDRDFRLPGHRRPALSARLTMHPARTIDQTLSQASPPRCGGDAQGTAVARRHPATRRRRDADPGTAARRWVPGTARRSSPDARASHHGRPAGQGGAARRTPGDGYSHRRGMSATWRAAACSAR